MKRLSLAAVVLSVAGACFLPAPVHAQSNVASIEYDRKEEKRIRELYNAFENAWNAHKVDDMANQWALDGDHQEPDGHIAKGREDVRALFKKQHETVFKNTVLDLSIDAVWFITADVALVEGTYSVAGAVAPDGTELPARQGHLTAVLLKEADTWSIAASRLMIPTQLPYKQGAAPATE
jgi:uncharacterized protein (TIGR02246 family)